MAPKFFLTIAHPVCNSCMRPGWAAVPRGHASTRRTDPSGRPASTRVLIFTFGNAMKKTFALLAATCLWAGVSVHAQQPPAADPLDADGNGLYDNRERKALLDALQKLAPELTGTFDADGDGEVTIAEQTAGRHPLSMIIPAERIIESETKIPWGIDIFPEWISTAYFQEDAQTGPVTELVPRGVFDTSVAKPTVENKRPVKSGEGSGIEFAASTGQQLTMPGRRHARWDYRWVLLTFRVDPHTGTDAETYLLDLNRGNGSGLSSPKIWYHMDLGLHVQYVGTNKGGLDKRVMVSENVVADGETWNVLVCGIRYGQMYASLNGVPMTTEKPQPERFSSDLPGRDVTSTIGDDGQGHMAWALDALVFGMTEPSEAMVEKLTGWAAHRLGVQANLPEDHPYRNDRPVLDAEDFPDRYVHDDEKWNAWGEKATKKSLTRANAGQPRVEPKGFERVFYDDFRASRLSKSTSGQGDLWLGPGFNTAVGVSATLIPPGEKPNAYPYDKENQKQTLSLVKQGEDRWRGSALYTVNDLGHGYTWKGPKVFRIRCMFPQVPQEELNRGLFPAFWSYDPDFLFWRTANRIEVDYFEFDGKNGQWLNGFSTHYHYSHVRNNIFAKHPESYKRYKIYGADMTEEATNIPGGLFVWDGQYHTWEFVMDDEVTYINVSYTDESGQERWVELARAPTAPTYLRRLNLQMNYALKGKVMPTERQDFVVDFVEVLQKTEDLDRVPEPFTAKPTLSGSNTAGSTVTCEPNVEGVTDIRYYWFADGYPLTWGTRDSYKITEAEAGKEIRCMVKAVGARDMPEAWSDVLN